MKKIHPLLVLFPFFLLLSGSSQREESAGDPPSEDLKDALRELEKDPALKHGRIAFIARDLSEQEELASMNPELLLNPASTLKLLSTIGALEVLGEEHRYETVLGYEGRISKNTLVGDLILKGGGDPAFLSEEFPEHYGTPKELYTGMVEAMKEEGLDGVEGRLLADGTHFAHNTLSRGRIWEDMGNYYGAFPSGLSYRDNSFEIHFETPENAGQPTKIKELVPDPPLLEIENRVRSSNKDKDRAYMFGKPYDAHRIIEGTLPKGRDDYVIEGAMPSPPRVAAYEAAQVFGDRGFKVREGVGTFRFENKSREPLDGTFDTIASPPLKEIVHVTNRESKNLFAEHLLLSIGKGLADTSQPRAAGEALLDRIEEWGIDTKGIRIEDGSGLAPTNRLHAAFLVDLLDRAWSSSYRDILLNSLPVAGKSNSMRRVGKGTKLEGRLKAKSGYMTGVRAYAGYLEKAEGGPVAFAFIVNDHTCSSSEIRKKMEKVMVAMAG